MCKGLPFLFCKPLIASRFFSSLGTLSMLKVSVKFYSDRDVDTGLALCYDISCQQYRAIKYAAVAELADA